MAYVFVGSKKLLRYFICYFVVLAPIEDNMHILILCLTRVIQLNNICSQFVPIL